MKMKKLFAGLLATSMMVAGTSVFADEIANDAGYNKDAGTYSIASDLSSYGSDQMTIIIIPEAAYNEGAIDDADILYIDQAAADTENIFANVGILGGTELADGTYYVKIGGENIAEDGIIVEKFTITTTAEGTTITVVWGDVNNTKEVELGDMNAVVNFILGTADTYGDYTVGASVGDVIWGDVNNTKEVELGDMNAIVNYILGTADTYGDYTVGQNADITITK